MQFHEKLFFDLFDFTSFFAWTFLNFLARCELAGNLIFLLDSNHDGGGKYIKKCARHFLIKNVH